ncbi:MAG: M48 family metalloprotease [Gammaproteobacteria bacterium]|nr:M48 family metalloprotease [Gammaproteobacteria bacterium]
MNRLFSLAAAAGLALSTFNVADAGRTRISTEIAQSDYTLKDVELEVRFGREMSAVILADFKMMDQQELNRYVNLVGQTVLQQSSRQDIPFHFAVINSPVINAYAAPGGYIFVTRGALNLMRSEAELAGVLAHEIAHVAQRHIVKALKIKAEDDSALGSVSRIIGSTSSSANVVFDQVVDKAIEILFSEGLKRQDEFEADEIGIVLTAMAGYEPLAYYQYLQRIQPYVERPGAEMSKTHPPITSRLKKLQNIIDNEGLASLQGHINTARFENHLIIGE